MSYLIKSPKVKEKKEKYEVETPSKDYAVMGIPLTSDEYSKVNSAVIREANNNSYEWNSRPEKERKKFVENTIYQIRGKYPETEQNTETLEVQTNKTPKQAISYLQTKNPNISKHNYSFEVKDNNSLSLTLGNVSDAGWFWDGNEKDIVGFTYRLHQSKVEDEFYSDMKKNEVSFNQLKPLYYESADTKDGLYEITGDNRRWQFGENGVDDYYMLQEQELTESQKEQFYSEYSPTNYETFEEKYGEDYKKDVKKAIKTSGSFREFNIKMDELRTDYTQKAMDMDKDNAYSIINKIKTEQTGTNLAKYKKV
jgi:hypothetical protein